MNTSELKSIPSRINHAINQTKFTQGNIIIKCDRIFKDKSHYFDNTFIFKELTTNKVCIKKFVELLMYITNDIMISKEEYTKYFENSLERSGDYLKTISNKHRLLKIQIMRVLEDNALLCDYPNCMKFYSNLLKMNIVFIIGQQVATHNALFSKTVVIYNNNSEYDFSFNKNIELKKYKTYISEKLLSECKLDDLKKYATIYEINTKNINKPRLLEELTNLVI